MATLGKSTITTLSLLNALSVEDGGTGATTFASGAALIGNGASAFATRAITNNTSATAVTASTNLITANTLYYHKGNSNITTVGTITSGTWNGTKIANAYLANSAMTIAGTSVSLGGSIAAATLKSALGLENVTNTAASEYLTALSSNTTNAVSITVGGTTKNITAATMKSSLGLGSLAYASSVSANSVTQGYVNIHPENTPIVIPFIHNDIAFINKKGGSYSIYSTTSTDYTVASLSKTEITVSNGDNMFDGSPSYAMISTTGSYVAVIDITLHKTFTYSNVFYIDFGASGWRTKGIAIYVMNTATETAYTLKDSTTSNSKGHWYTSVSHTSTNSSGSTVQGFNRLRVVLSNFNNTSSTSGKRIAQVGLMAYNSAGVTETFISRGGCSGIYGNLIPYTTNSYNLGSSSKKWANVYATTFTGALSGNATTATTATNATKLNGQEASYYATASSLSSYLPLTGGEIEGTVTLDGQLVIKGNAADHPLIVRGVTGSTGTGAVGPLYLQYGADNIIKLGNSGGYSISADGGTYSGTAANATNAAQLNGQAASYYATASSLASFLTLDGARTMTGEIKAAETKGILLRHANTTYTAGIGYDTQGNECIAMWAKNSVTRLRWHAGTDMSSTTYQQMMSITPDFEISKADGTAKGYIGGSAIITAANIDSYIPDGSGNTVDLTNYVVKNGTGVQCIGGGLVIGSTSTTTAAAAGRIMITGHTNPLIGLIATGSSTPFYFQVANDIVYLGPTSSKALSFDANGNTGIPANLTVTGTVTAPTFVGALSGNATTATTATNAEYVSSFEVASSSSTKRRVWMSWNSNNGQAAYDDNLTYQTSTDTLFAPNISGHLIGNGNYYGVCDTAAATAAKTVTINGFPSTITTGLRVTIKFTDHSGVASPTLSINGGTAYNLRRYGTTDTGVGTTTSGWVAGAVMTFTFDGVAWVREYWSNTTYSNVSLGQGYATCSTAATTTAKTASLSSYALSTGGIVSVKFTYDVPASATLNINNKGAKAMYYRGTAITDGVIKAGDTATFIYSTYYHLVSVDRAVSGRVAVIEETATNKTISPNVFYKWNNMTNLTIVLGIPTDTSILNDYMFEVTASSSGCQLTMQGVKWADGRDVGSLEANATYQFSIINNCAVWTKFV